MEDQGVVARRLPFSVPAAKSSPGDCGRVTSHANYRISRIDIVHIYVYSTDMKRRELEKLLRQLGWQFLRHGGKHDIWTNGEQEEAIPRHAEINEKLARLILRRAGRRD